MPGKMGSGKVLQERVLSSQEVFEGRIIRVRRDEVELPGGRRSAREVVEHPGAVAVVAVDDQGEVLLVRQYRHAVGRVTLEIPAGTLKPGEDPLDCARRELEEETGCRAESFHRLASFYTTPGFTSELMHLYLAEGLRSGAQNPDEDEDLELVRLPLPKALEVVTEEDRGDGKSLAGLLLAEKHLRCRKGPTKSGV